MEENLIEGECKNEFANGDESLEAKNININESGEQLLIPSNFSAYAFNRL